MIDVDELHPMDRPLPKDNRHRHFGGGQTEVSLDLPPGQRALQPIMGNASDVPNDPPAVSEKIRITVP